MNPLLRLYPRTWRDRYGDELERLLEDDPPGFTAMVDLVRGALDARLHASLVPQAAGGGPVPVPGDLPAVRRRFPVGAFLGTLSAGLFLVTGAIIASQQSLPYIIGYQLANAFVAIASVTLGLTVMTNTGRGIIAKLAGLTYLVGIIFLLWDQSWVPAVLAITAGSVLLGIGSLIEGRPRRWIGVLTLLLGAAIWVVYRTENEVSLGLVVAGFAAVAAGLARAGGGSLRPIVGGIAVTGILAALIVGSTLATSEAKVHDGYSVRCGEVETATCMAAVDALTTKVRAVLPDALIVSAWLDEGVAKVCTQPPALADGSRGTYDASWINGISADASLGLWAGPSAFLEEDPDHYLGACWHLT